MKRLICLVMATFLPWITISAQVLVSDSLMTTRTVFQLQLAGIADAANDVDVYRLVYNTTDGQGNATIASGALMIPKVDSCVFPMVSYQHGTVVEKDDVPSRLNSESSVGYFSASTGYVTVMPDYVGLGDSPGMHPYVHAESQATAVMDIIRAAREFCQTNNILLHDQLFLVGYSQGGHATMAAHQIMQTQFSSEFSVTASAPCSGPFDLSETQAEPMVANMPYSQPFYVPYVIFAYQSVYGNLYGTVDEVFKSPYDTTLFPLFDGFHDANQINAAMPSIPGDALDSVWLDGFMNDPQHSARVALRDNDVYAWVPTAPVRMYYCGADEQVFHENSLLARDTMNALGAADVQAIEIDPNGTHGSCAIPALTTAKAWFDTMKKACDDTTSTGLFDRSKIDESLFVFPNPMNEFTFIDLPESSESYELYVIDTKGQIVQSHTNVKNGRFRLEKNGLPAGTYILEARGASLYRTRLVIQ